MREFRLSDVLQAALPEVMEELENEELQELVGDHGLSVVVAAIVEYYKQLLRMELTEGIENFDPPDTYDPDAVEVDPMAKAIGQVGVILLTVTLTELDEPGLSAYADRILKAALSLDQDDSLAPIFVFTSVQDGLMHWLCEYDDIDPDRVVDGSPVYYSGTKRDTLEILYQEVRDVTTGESVLIAPNLFISNLEAFYKHRNAIMHGDPDAHLDLNIATISLLFLDLTLYVVLEKIEAFDRAFGIPEDEDWETLVSKLSSKIDWEELGKPSKSN